MPERDGTHTEAGAERVKEMAERAGAVVLGPGIGKGADPGAFARKLAQLTDKPLLIDADGLNAFAGALEELAKREAPTVLTPHAGELGRLLGVESSEIERRRLHHASRGGGERSGCVVVLKGDDSIVAQPGERPTAISPGATPGARHGRHRRRAQRRDRRAARPRASGRVRGRGRRRPGPRARGHRGRRGIGGADHVIAGDVIDAIPAAFTR